MSSFDCIIGIDPGQNGGIAVLSNLNKNVPKILNISTSTYTEIDEFFKDLTFLHSPFAFIEYVHSMPGNSPKSMFSFGKNYGALLMSLISNSIPFEYVLPQKWQSKVALGVKLSGIQGPERKRRLKARAQELFPDTKVTLGNADALLIAYYGHEVKNSLL